MTLLPYRADHYPLVGNLLHKIDLARVFSNIAEPEASQAEIDVGTVTSLMILNILGDVNIRLYRLKEFFEEKALPLLVPWKPDIKLSQINDDRAARALDAIWKADPKKVFTAVAHQAIKTYDLDTSIIHVDTTSKSFYGAYDTQDEDDSVPNIKHGHPKDHRPDLKQLVFRAGTTEDGVPIIAEVIDGNASDKTTNGLWIQNLKTILHKDKDEFLLYIADSALVTTKTYPTLSSSSSP